MNTRTGMKNPDKPDKAYGTIMGRQDTRHQVPGTWTPAGTRRTFRKREDRGKRNGDKITTCHYRQGNVGKKAEAAKNEQKKTEPKKKR